MMDKTVNNSNKSRRGRYFINRMHQLTGKWTKKGKSPAWDDTSIDNKVSSLRDLMRSHISFSIVEIHNS
jgi:hypothetical protein